MKSLPRCGAALALLLLLSGEAAGKARIAAQENTSLRARFLLHRTVQGPGGETIGSVVDLFLSPEGEIRGVILEAGGIFGIGSRRYDVPWSLVRVGDTLSLQYDERQLVSYRIGAGGAGPVTASAGSRAPAPGAGEAGAKRRPWRISELLGDTVRLRDGGRFGVVYDAVFDEAGRIRAILSVPERLGAGGELVELPFQGYGDGFYPSDSYVALPYSIDEAGRADPGDDRGSEADAALFRSLVASP